MTQSLSVLPFLTTPGVILDVRSPSEYLQGHIPGAVSFPLFTDAERAQVGICYKQQGRDAAVELGFALAGPKFAGLLRTAKDLAGDRPVRLHCWRGGLRSEAVAWVLATGGLSVLTLEGGYKTFRRWVRSSLATPRSLVLLGGMTGTGKTAILHEMAALGAQVLDLEAIAHHRGSSFGSLGLPPQPTQEQFDNYLAMQWATFDPQIPVWIEAESRQIGHCRIPNELFLPMTQAPMLQVTRPRSERLDRLVETYDSIATVELIAATQRIQKRLGGLRTQQAIALLQDRQLHAAFDLLLDYYDRTYQYDLEQRSPVTTALDITGLSAPAAAKRLLQVATQWLERPLSRRFPKQDRPSLVRVSTPCLGKESPSL